MQSKKPKFCIFLEAVSVQSVLQCTTMCKIICTGINMKWMLRHCTCLNYIITILHYYMDYTLIIIILLNLMNTLNGILFAKKSYINKVWFDLMRQQPFYTLICMCLKNLLARRIFCILLDIADDWLKLRCVHFTCVTHVIVVWRALVCGDTTGIADSSRILAHFGLRHRCSVGAQISSFHGRRGLLNKRWGQVIYKYLSAETWQQVCSA